ncbi:M67 family metallopeptidase [Oscillatoria sp. CS-180]|uniref:M67 family metallopeptidase n=1 Tax=Oscillatoria sp. CS-180 TaxID=3021720 RepID=UPI00232C7EBA|nr:M67 family metallopeptidase [Oscillatoria sp. CS-180]MDB9526567.1 M67 family metallopeptidase [Oscillatoria sp. CS-180]
MALIFQPDQIHTMRVHAEQTYPEECCGLLLGTHDPKQGDRQVCELRPLNNDWTTSVNPFADSDASTVSKRSRYWVDPQALMMAQRYVREQGWVVLGVYHSHPDHPAVPSERDRQLAWSDYSYPILSVIAGKVTTIASWRLDDEGRFQLEVVIDSKKQY